ncbi:hypothetical protein AB835_14195 [Candidatus Endobugula sertula]|uniref:Uncharacterized protein n=1 Tax=Candidatus Endobugula sertula TaxID=62101 RepID=A0A1D2QLH8_9GAMM|nr:hypothetical protein AB835_14195 [Candidatus Endobugula sertula]
MKIIILVVGILIGALSTLLFTSKLDLLSVGKASAVTLENDVTIVLHNDSELIIPKDTKLNFVSQYDDVGEFALNVVITDLSLVKPVDGGATYFSKQGVNEK